MSMEMTTVSTQFTPILMSLGLTANEAAVYLAALELGPSSIWDIAQKSGVKRTSCYVILDGLVAQGLASKTEATKHTVYSVVAPKHLIAQSEARHRALLNSVAELEGLASKSPNKPTVRLFEGEEGVKQVYSQTIAPGVEEILIYATPLVLERYGRFLKDYVIKRAEQGVKARAILPDTPESRAVAKRDKAESRTSRFLLEAQFNPRTEVNIFGDSIAYIAHSETAPFATLVESAALAKDEKERFELLWAVAK